MKIVAVLGSPRAGANSAILAETFLKEAERLGAQTERFRLSKLNYKGCLGCGRCKLEQKECVQRDDLTPVLEAVRSCDALVVASPVYFLDVTSQMKAFVDRCYSFCEPHRGATPYKSRLAKGKALVFITSQGAQDTFFADIPPRYNFSFKMIGFEPMHVIRACGLGYRKDAVARREDLLESAQETARKVVAGEPPLWDIAMYPIPYARE